MTSSQRQQGITLADSDHAVQCEGLGLFGIKAEKAASIVGLSEWLAPSDRLLVRTVLADGKPVRDVAAMFRQRPRRIREKLRSLSRRVKSPEFAFVVVHRDQWEHNLRRVAEACVLRGESIASAARRLGMAASTARRLRATVRAMAQGATIREKTIKGVSNGGEVRMHTSGPRSAGGLRPDDR